MTTRQWSLPELAPILLLVAGSNCAAGLQATGIDPNILPGAGAPASAAPATGEAPGPGEDRHWVQADDYFIAEEAWQSGWIHVGLAKMKQAPSAQSKREARFFRLNDSKDVWTAHFWRTRIADRGDLALGQFGICFEGSNQSGAYEAPAGKDAARTGSWFMGKITDLSDLYKGVVRVDTYKCALGNVRLCR
jgi:hypothetical protein